MTATDIKFPLISEAIASMDNPARFFVGEYVLVISHCPCSQQLQAHPGRIVVLGRIAHRVRLLQLGRPIIPVAVYDILKADVIEDSDKL